MLPILPACQLFASSRTKAPTFQPFRLGLSSYLDIHFVLTKRFDTAENVAEDRSLLQPPMFRKQTVISLKERDSIQDARPVTFFIFFSFVGTDLSQSFLLRRFNPFRDRAVNRYFFFRLFSFFAPLLHRDKRFDKKFWFRNRRDHREFHGIFCRNEESCDAFVKCGFDDDRIFEGK